jgi:Uma2 family endonuclease
MPAVLNLPEQKVVLKNVSWETYQRLLTERQESCGTRFTYDQGRLEIMVVSQRHEELNRALAMLVEVVVEEMGIDIRDPGSTTFQREDLDRGFEPDSCFYIRSAELINGVDQVDLTVDPPPDLVIEIDITSHSLNKLSIFAALGVPEVWRYDGARLRLLKLDAGEYVEVEESAALSGVTAEALTGLIEARRQMKRTAWLRRLRQWAQTLTAKNGPAQ